MPGPQLASDTVPDAVAAVISAVVTRHPGAEPVHLGRLVVAELRSLGWQITVPTQRADAA